MDTDTDSPELVSASLLLGDRDVPMDLDLDEGAVPSAAGALSDHAQQKPSSQSRIRGEPKATANGAVNDDGSWDAIPGLTSTQTRPQTKPTTTTNSAVKDDGSWDAIPGLTLAKTARPNPPPPPSGSSNVPSGGPAAAQSATATAAATPDINSSPSAAATVQATASNSILSWSGSSSSSASNLPAARRRHYPSTPFKPTTSDRDRHTAFDLQPTAATSGPIPVRLPPKRPRAPRKRTPRGGSSSFTGPASTEAAPADPPLPYKTSSAFRIPLKRIPPDVGRGSGAYLASTPADERRRREAEREREAGEVERDQGREPVWKVGPGGVFGWGRGG
ncbi:hypothetical protein FA13DRAFT_1821124 [Coprinellus micaceus]|uniref:Uncharacterized protein n=1 Tax=Coprinellus micaceus TaxID=71717 RepID=A0A4Y7SD14_COPMI|nr:hypothetical protein FA13DRAFT_1821124 [Coprinellus micaceus]